MNVDEQARGDRWIRRGMAVLVALTVALMLLLVFSLSQSSRQRTIAAQRAEQTLAELHELVVRLDRQAAALDRQTTVLEDQAAELQRQAERAERSREQFRRAVDVILDQLGSDVDAFAEEQADAAARAPTGAGDAPAPREPQTATEPEPVEPEPGCVRSSGKPPKCGDDDARP